MRDSMYIGEVPYEEDCAQLGKPGYARQAKKECLVFIGQLERTFGPPPQGARLYIKSNPHDFGTYYAVECSYCTEEGEEYALTLEGEGPSRWDSEAREELGLNEED